VTKLLIKSPRRAATFTARFLPEDAAEIDRLAERHGLSRAAFIRALVLQAIGRNQIEFRRSKKSKAA
jgi:hypothetical protein